MSTSRPGGCQCGQVRFTLTGNPLFTYACHCSDCQKRTGSAFSMGLVILSDSLQLDGELSPWERISDEGNRNTRYSCSACGNVIYGSSTSSPGLFKLQPGLLDDTADICPEVHIWFGQAQSWITLPEGVPRFETQPHDTLEMLQVAQDYQQLARG